MSAELVQALRELEREKGISFETILRGLEEALASAYKSTMKIGDEELEEGQPHEDARVSLDPESGEMRAFVQQVDGDGNVVSEHEAEVPEDFKGRIAAQTAKQVILQKLREAEREITYEEFAGREGDVVTGIVQQHSTKATFLDLGKVEALLPFQEKVPAESYRQGERLKVYIVEVRRTGKGPQIIVSRTHPELLKALFAMEVPEIAEGLVEIKAVAREPGHRSKIAVVSNEPGVDPVGACVGAKGSRVRMVVNELRGEKIDVVEWSDDASRFVAKALAPASVKEVRIDEGTQTALVIVPDFQLSLAIGKEGQNARLAARLTGWRIDIKSESQLAEDEAAARAGRAAPAAEEEAPPPPPEEPAAPEEPGHRRRPGIPRRRCRESRRRRPSRPRPVSGKRRTRRADGPERRCVACRRRRPKGDLLRIVRSPARVVAVDADGTAPGRGAYVCRDDASCAAGMRAGLGRALGVALREADLARLTTEIETEIGPT